MTEYKIIIENNTGKSGESKAVAGNESTDLVNNPKNSEGLGGKDVLKAGLVAYGKAKPWIKKVASHEISMVELRTGSREAQMKSEFIYDIACAGVDVVESGLMGFAIGNVPGAIVSIGLSVASKGISIAQNVDRLNSQRNLENESIQRNYIRAGARGSRASYE